MQQPWTVEDECDYVVVGAGSAGCVVAARLSESGRNKVVLLEAGGPDRGFWIDAPLGFGKLYNDPSVNWGYESEPEQGLDGTSSYQPRGKIVGGTGSINGMVYMRGSRADYDRWRDLGNPGWGYEDILPYFLRSEANVRGPSRFHGSSGPINVVDGPTHELGAAFLQAAIESGFADVGDHSGEAHSGFAVPQMTIRRGRRSSSASGYLRPALRRSNLRVVMRAQVKKLLVEDRIATGVDYKVDGRNMRLKARREVIVCAGVFNTPQLLQLSGLGPASVLQSAGIPVIMDIPGVGNDLEDHFGVNLVYRCCKKVTLTDALNNPLRRLAMGLEYLILRRGPIATHGTYCTGFFRSRYSCGDEDDGHISLVGWARSTTSRATRGLGLYTFPAYSLTASLTRPLSRGSVRLRPGDPEAAPNIRFNFLQDARDQKRLVDIVRIARRIACATSMHSYTESEVLPGADLVSDGDLLAFCRRYGRSTHHAAGSCKMGPDGPVDARLRLRGIDRLRIVDASIMPSMVAGNINATVIMIAEKAAAQILEDASSNCF